MYCIEFFALYSVHCILCIVCIFSRPCIDKSLLEKYNDGLIISTACLGGEIPQAILKGRIDVAENTAVWYKKLFGDDFYLEIQDHGSIEDRIVNVELIRIGKEHQIKEKRLGGTYLNPSFTTPASLRMFARYS